MMKRDRPLEPRNGLIKGLKSVPMRDTPCGFPDLCQGESSQGREA